MFCPKCGAPDQSADSYCRQCGTFLYDAAKPAKRESPPEENLKVNTVLNLMTVVVCFSLAAALYVVFGIRSTTHPMIYITAGLLLAMGGWHIQTFIRTRQLKRQWKRRGQKESDLSLEQAAITGKLLNEADFENVVPPSVTDRTTRHLAEADKRSAQPEH
jgi:hypothetical protein